MPIRRHMAMFISNWQSEWKRANKRPDSGGDACDEGDQLAAGADAHSQHPVLLVAWRLQCPLQELL